MSLVEYTEFLVKSIVKNPDMVKVTSYETEEGVNVEVMVHHDDMGATIGKGGKTATALRTLIQAYAFLQKMPKLKINIDSF